MGAYIGKSASPAKEPRRPIFLEPPPRASIASRFLALPVGRLRSGLPRRKRRDPERGDPVALFAQHLKPETVEGEGLPRLGNGAGFMNDEAGDSRGLFVGQVPVHGAVEVTDRHRTVDDDGAVALLADALNGNVVLVANIADDLLDDVLERHQTLHHAIFVDDQS